MKTTKLDPETKCILKYALLEHLRAMEADVISHQILEFDFTDTPEISVKVPITVKVEFKIGPRRGIASFKKAA